MTMSERDANLEPGPLIHSTQGRPADVDLELVSGVVLLISKIKDTVTLVLLLVLDHLIYTKSR